MIKLSVTKERLSAAMQAHANAVTAYVQTRPADAQKEIFAQVTKLLPMEQTFEAMVEAKDWSWLRKFILAEVDTLRRFTQTPELLQFETFRRLYNQRFSNGSTVYVDENTHYNAYTFLENLGITVCPYCEEEYIEILHGENGQVLRTAQVDHFFPKSKFPALAMCFFNLVPCGPNCNRIKLENPLGMSPFEEEIESCTWLYPDLPIGVQMENVTEEDCTIHFHPQVGMQSNVETLCLEERYKKHRKTAYDYLRNTQLYTEEKIDELVRTGLFPSREAVYHLLFDLPLPGDTEQKLLSKLRRDIVGR